MKKKACKSCKLFVDGDICSACKRDAFTTNWQGRIHFVRAEKSFIAQQMGVTHDGEYAIKVR